MSLQRLGLTDLILCEVLQGIRENDFFIRVRRDLLNFELFHTGGAELAVASAQSYRSLCVQGYTVRKTIDCLIATFCLEAGHALLHRDRDFDPFENLLGLRVVPSVAQLLFNCIFGSAVTTCLSEFSSWLP